MKRSLNFLLILSIICFVITQVLCDCSIVFNEFDLFPVTNEVIDNVNNGGNNAGIGEYFIIAGFLGLTIDFSIMFLMTVMLIFIPLILNGSVIIFQIVANLFQLGHEKQWKNIAGKVLTFISMIAQILMCIVLFILLINKFPISKLIMLVTLAINIFNFVLFIKEFIKMTKIRVHNN